MLILTALFSGLMLLNVGRRRRVVAVLLIGCVAILGVSPPPAQAQLPFCLPCVIQAVLTTITVTIGGWLTQINGVLGRLFSLFTQTVWPLAKTNLAKSQIQSIIARFLGVIQSIMSITHIPPRCRIPRHWRPSFATAARLILLPFRKPMCKLSDHCRNRRISPLRTGI